MLEVLCGNKNIQKILIFLFVNGKCYGTQLHRSLITPLTPLQKALARLEKGGLIRSYYEGKTRVYQFNPSYPLIEEVEILLKKAYTLLPTHEKKHYYALKTDEVCSSSAHAMQILITFWAKLQKVKALTFNAHTKEESVWKGKGQGDVFVSKTGDNILLFQEKGVWQGREQELNFSNLFRWSFDRQAGVISLEHLRRGPDHPVFLFHLAPSGKNSLTSVGSHLCEGDNYFGQIYFDEHGLRLNWRVIGPKKNEEIDYYYS